jgi:hypothetical protein
MIKEERKKAWRIKEKDMEKKMDQQGDKKGTRNRAE